MNAADLIANILKQEGVEFLAVYPHNELIEACAKLGIRSITARTERIALNMADGFTRATGGRRNGVAAVQFGPGSENAYGAMAQAFGDGTPMLYLPTAYARSDLGIKPNFEGLLPLSHVSKYSGQPRVEEQIIPCLRQAFAAIRNGKPGPACVELPIDLLAT